MEIINVTPENVAQETFFCARDPKSRSFQAKNEWFKERFKEGMKIKIMKDNENQIAFIEYIPAEYAWRPVEADNYMFIHCMFTYSNAEKGKGYGSELICVCEEEAKQSGKRGVAVMTSKGVWITDKRIFEKQGYTQSDKKGRFELMCKKFDPAAPDPKLIDWEVNIKQYQGWHLLYSDQCPWHGKSVKAISEVAIEHGIHINIQKVTSSKEAKQMPSGFGVFNLIRDGKLLEDHYISEARFRNILKKELK